jgi:hypothetical protein
MARDRDRLDKVLAIAVNPGAYEPEAVAALRAARQLIKKNPALAHPPPHPRVPPKTRSSRRTLTPGSHNQYRAILAVHCRQQPFQQAYGLGLKSKIVIDFKAMPYALDVRCDGAETACDAFARYVDRLIDYINSQPRRPSLAS